jgi:hypothetical protein
MGMFNRRTVSIKAEELDADLKFFDLVESSLESAGYEHHTVAGQMGRQLLPSEKLFGSFFFQKLEAVHKTEETIKDRDRNVPTRPDDTAYEFLHNTFGEFLTADFMLRGIFEKTGNIRDQANKRSARNRRFSRSTASKIDLTTFDKMWYARFIYAPLFSRAVVLRLLREWSRHCLQKEERDIREFLEDLDTIITNHINILLSNNDLPSLMTSDQRPSLRFPLLVILPSIHSICFCSAHFLLVIILSVRQTILILKMALVHGIVLPTFGAPGSPLKLLKNWQAYSTLNAMTQNLNFLLGKSLIVLLPEIVLILFTLSAKRWQIILHLDCLVYCSMMLWQMIRLSWIVLLSN